ncbi:MAG: AfsR/SARP family transcriptional regulator [Candidatus Promineifilaceae bacterium]
MTRLNITLLGPAAITLDNTAVSDIKTTKALALLAYLVLEPDRPHRREALAGLFWPESTENAARASLRQAFSNLRKVLEPAETGDTPLFISSRESVQLNPQASLNLDVAGFNQRLAFTQTHNHRRIDTCAICIEKLSQAAALYQGDLLSGISLPDSPQFENWLRLRREALHRQVMQALTVLAKAALRTTDYETTLQLAIRQLELEPWRESAHRQAMRAYAYSGRRAAALAHYEQARQILADELAIEPEDETAELYYRIRDNALGPGPADRRLTTNLPEPTTSLIGREHDLAELSRLIANPNCRLLLLIGPGGVGKTRLAQEMAASLESSFAHGAAFIPLVSAQEPNDVLSAITDTLGLRLQSGTSEEEQLLKFLEKKELLLVLDNYEQILPQVGFLERLLARAPGVVPLVTSRHRLGLSAEWVYELKGLFVPPLLNEPEKPVYSSVQLFSDRARRVNRHFQLSPENKQAVTFICRLTGGLPLAIELAAALVRYESVDQIAGHLQEELMTLSTAHSDLDPRHRSINAAFEHSWRLLSPSQQALFSRLSVFRGGFTPELAAEVCESSRREVFDLIDKSLIMRMSDDRLELHELLRQFAGDKLAESGAGHATRQKHLAVFSELAKKGESALYGSPEQLTWQQKLEQEHANMRAAHEWGIENDIQEAAEMAAANWLYYFMHGHFDESQRIYDTLLEHRDGISPTTYAWLLNGRCSVALAAGDLTALQANAHKALALFQKIDDPRGIALSYHHLLMVITMEGDFHRAQQLVDSGMSAARGFPWIEAVVLQHQANIYELQGALDLALQTNRRREHICEQIDDGWGALYATMSVAQLEIKRMNFQEAQNLLRSSLSSAETYHELQIISWIERLLGLIALASAEPQQAVAHFQQSKELLQSIISHGSFFEDYLQIGIAQTEAKRFRQAKKSFDQAYQLVVSEPQPLAQIGLLEHAARLRWLQKKDVKCAQYLSAAAARRGLLQLPAEYPYDVLIQESLEAMRREIAAEEFESQWQAGRERDPAELLHELLG